MLWKSAGNEKHRIVDLISSPASCNVLEVNFPHQRATIASMPAYLLRADNLHHKVGDIDQFVAVSFIAADATPTSRST